MSRRPSKKSENAFCKSDDLKNEATVERCFVERLLSRLGYKDQQICPKTSLHEISVGNPRRRNEARYRPDYAIKVGMRVRWLIEAKAPSEDIENWVGQPREYVSFLNGQYPSGTNPVELFLVTNGIQTLVYKYDQNDPVLSMEFDDFLDGNSKFERILKLLLPTSFSQTRDVSLEEHMLRITSIEEVNSIFARCHQYIHVKEGLSQQAAFMEFVKVVFLKLLSDKEIRQAYPQAIDGDELPVPATEVRFSLSWINNLERETSNPLSSIQFRKLIDKMEREIQEGVRKRVFDPNEVIDLKPQTIKYIVSKLEHLYLFGIDVDLNGRLFETFLNATMRGKDLGQFFTPRSVVKLGTKLARIKVYGETSGGNRHTDTVVDACCGSGGFLIEALADIWAKIDSNSSLSDKVKDEIKRKVANENILGVDFGKEPPLARIARLNMYLHGDGGARIYFADALDKDVLDFENDSTEMLAEKAELRKVFSTEFADVILTNPPFAKTYDRDSVHEERVLDDYDLSTFSDDEDEVLRPALKSSVMFIERYFDILKPGGTLVSVLDDGLLGGKEYKWFRSFLRRRFIVRAVISLPGDAFQRSNARVKTSLVVLQKRIGGEDDDQPSTFMYASRYIGIDDPARQRTLAIDYTIREKAVEEINKIEEEYRLFLTGSSSGEYVVDSDRLVDRLDVKSCLYPPARKLDQWSKLGLDVHKVAEWIEPVTFREEDTIVTENCDDEVRLLFVGYDGSIGYNEIIASDCKYNKLYRISEGDIVVSRINAVHGAIGVVTSELGGGVVTPTEYRVMRTSNGLNPKLIWMLLRTYEARSEFLLTATGIGRTRVEWDSLSKMSLPFPDAELQKSIEQLVEESDALERKVSEMRANAAEMLQRSLDLNNDEALSIVQAFKPPK